jgi:hypothetical protein
VGEDNSGGELTDLRASVDELFHDHADAFSSQSPVYAVLCRHMQSDPSVLEILRDVGDLGNLEWDVPLRLLAGIHFLALTGDAPDVQDAYENGLDPWPAVADVLVARREWLARHVSEQPVQTNEVHRSWALTPAFLTAFARYRDLPIDVIELGCSAGLNLYWDRYLHVYENGEFGARRSPLVLSGEERRPVDRGTLSLRPRIRGRIGVDLQPIDPASPRDARLLESFFAPDQPDRRARLRAAIRVAQEDPPTLVEGELLEVLPALLADRAHDALTLVFETATLIYASQPERDRLAAILERAGRDGQLAWVTTTSPLDELEDGFGVAVRTWPGDARTVAHMHFHGRWLDWRL